MDLQYTIIDVQYRLRFAEAMTCSGPAHWTSSSLNYYSAMIEHIKTCHSANESGPGSGGF